MLEGDVGLGADIRDLGVSSGADQFRVRGPTENLNHNGLLGGAEGLHCLVMGGLREVLAIDLEGEGEKQTEKNRQKNSVCFFPDGEETTETR